MFLRILETSVVSHGVSKKCGCLEEPSIGEPESASSNPFENLVNRLKPDKMSGRTMKFPYTFSSKVALFPYNYYFKNVWFVRYYIVGATLCIPVFTWIQKQACSPANVAAFEAKKAAEGH
ncbi:uncharacterized protein roh isoform X2 [Panulirus ornatus]|uniref:uncharacterized protein roh isoform X2 n=1 Tax=Panulirus ornatus TaxID=150431 RepID=UPI003A86EDFB